MREGKVEKGRQGERGRLRGEREGTGDGDGRKGRKEKMEKEEEEWREDGRQTSLLLATVSPTRLLPPGKGGLSI